MRKNNHLNVILITIDALRADFVGFLSEHHKDKKISLTPNLDKLAESSVIFTNAITHAPYTSASFPSLFTSKYPSAASSFVSKRISVANYPFAVLKAEHPTMAEILKQYGYTTGGFHSSPWLVRTFKYDRGFDTFDDTLYLSNTNPILRRIPLTKHDLIHIIGKQSYLTAANINRKVIPWLERASKPFFLWIHYMDTHGPYQPKRGFAYLNKLRAELLWYKATRFPDKVSQNGRKSLISWYKEEITYLDEHLGTLFKVLENLNLYRDTVLIITSDHGEAFYERKMFSHPRLLYDELIRVPLIIKFPYLKEKKVISHPVGLIDILPTIVDILNFRLDGVQFDGNSLMPLIEKNCSDNLPDYVISDAAPEKGDKHVSLRTTKWKYIMNEEKGEHELYNLDRDPNEQINLIDKVPNVAEAFASKLKAVLPKIKGKYIETHDPKLDEGLRDRLKALGYMD